MKNLTFFLASLFLCSIAFGQSNTKKVLLEQFTNTTCPNCGNRNPTFKAEILDNYVPNQVIHLAYHNNAPLASDPFYQANIFDVNQRTNYYQNPGSPTLYLNGTFQSGVFGTMLQPASLTPNLNQVAEVSLEVEDVISGSNHSVSVTLNFLNNLPTGNYKLYVAVVEQHINFCTYFEYYFDNVFRTFLTPNTGQAVTPMAAGYAQSFSFNFTSDPDWNNDQIKVIAFLQNDTDKNILNANESDPIDNRRTVVEESDPFYCFAYIKDENCNNNNTTFIGNDFFEGSVEVVPCYDTAPFSENSNLTFDWSVVNINATISSAYMMQVNNAVNNNTSQKIENLPAGVFACTISDQYNNSASFNFTVEQPDPIIAFINSTNPSNNYSNGSININASGGQGNIAIQWDNPTLVNTGFVANNKL